MISVYYFLGLLYSVTVHHVQKLVGFSVWGFVGSVPCHHLMSCIEQIASSPLVFFYSSSVGWIGGN